MSKTDAAAMETNEENSVSGVVTTAKAAFAKFSPNADAACRFDKNLTDVC